MQIILAKYAGFCPGVKRAWSLVEKAVKRKKEAVCVFGDLCHNHQAIKQLEDWGVKTIHELQQANKGGLVVIRAHGEPPKTYQRLKELNLRFIDATCPSVARVQKLAKQLENQGYLLVICGEKNHPEAKATLGYTQKGLIISSVTEAKKVSKAKKIGVVSQTTFSSKVFKEICQVLKKKCQEFKSLGTICNFTQMAQKEARRIAGRVDLMIVVGGKHSSNTKRLVEVSAELVPAYHIETVGEIEKRWLDGVKKVGLLAGASTPDWIIKEALSVLRTKGAT